MKSKETSFRAPLWFVAGAWLAGSLFTGGACSAAPHAEDEPTPEDPLRVQAVPEDRLHPILECVDVPAVDGGPFIAHFGYDKGPGTGRVAVGPFNGFSPGLADRGQPTIFPGGTHHDVVQVPFDGSL